MIIYYSGKSVRVCILAALFAMSLMVMYVDTYTGAGVLFLLVIISPFLVDLGFVYRRFSSLSGAIGGRIDGMKFPIQFRDCKERDSDRKKRGTLGDM